MFSLFEPSSRRAKDEEDLRGFYIKYGAQVPEILGDRANDSGLSSRDRRHWRRLARKARRQQGQLLGSAKAI